MNTVTKTKQSFKAARILFAYLIKYLAVFATMTAFILFNDYIVRLFDTIADKDIMLKIMLLILEIMCSGILLSLAFAAASLEVKKN